MRIIVKEKDRRGKVSNKKGRKGKKETLLQINPVSFTLVWTSLKPLKSHAVIKQSQMISSRCLPRVKFVSSHTAVNTHSLASAVVSCVYTQQPWFVLI
jgi:hypothetical protein